MASKQPPDTTGKSAKKTLSMHDEVPVWADCCSCEAEPYWQEAMAEEEEKRKHASRPDE